MRIIHIKTNKHKFYPRRVLLVGFVCLTGSVLFNSSSAFADNLNTNVNIKPSLTLTIPESSIDLVLDPASKAFDSQDLHISIGTNNSTGYKLTMSADSTSLININDNTNTIPTIESASDYDEDSFPVNKWGYKISASSSNSSNSNNSNYLPFVSGTTILENNSKTNNDAATLTFASKIDYTKPAGLYNTILNFKTIPNVTQYYMQDLSNPTLAQEICTTDRPSIVIDKRDEQAYTIQRLPDGKCWMLDNLNLDLTNASIVAGLSPENTNADAEALNYLRNGGGTADDQWATVGLSLTNWDTAGTPSVPWVNIRGKCDSSINSSYPCIPNDIAYTSNNIASNSEYGLGTNRIGIYYNYCAVSAGSYCWGKNHMESTGYNIASDICPAGWRLPAGGPDSTSDFYTLCKVINNNTACGQGVDMSASNPNSLQYILSLPLSGDYRGGSAWFQGVANRLWSTSYYDPNNMYGFGAFSSRIQAWSTNGRSDGRSARCLLGE